MDPVGESTRHAASVHSGTCVLLLLNSTQVLAHTPPSNCSNLCVTPTPRAVRASQIVLMHNSFAAYYPSPYVDAYGEEDVGLRRARPLTLDSSRYRTLQQLWAGHDVVREIVRIRLAAERYIRQNWY
jgi:hypothetical protein